MTLNAPRLCPVCQAHGLEPLPLGAANKSGRCWRCARERRSGRFCRCGCGRALDERNLSGFSRPCLMREALRVAAEGADIPVVRLVRLPVGSDDVP